MKNAGDVIADGGKQTAFDDTAKVVVDLSLWDSLGKPEHTGMAFAVTRRALEVDYGGEVSKLPTPEYAHGIWFDTRTDNFIVARPDHDGRFHDLFKMPSFQRVR